MAELLSCHCPQCTHLHMTCHVAKNSMSMELLSLGVKMENGSNVEFNQMLNVLIAGVFLRLQNER